MRLVLEKKYSFIYHLAQANLLLTHSIKRPNVEREINACCVLRKNIRLYIDYYLFIFRHCLGLIGGLENAQKPRFSLLANLSSFK